MAENDFTYDDTTGARAALTGRKAADVASIFGDDLPVSGDRMSEWAGFAFPTQVTSIWDRVAA